MVLFWLLWLHPPWKHRHFPGFFSGPASTIRSLLITPKSVITSPDSANEIQTWILTHSPAGSTGTFQHPLHPSKSSFARELLFLHLYPLTLSLLILFVKSLIFLQLLQYLCFSSLGSLIFRFCTFLFDQGTHVPLISHPCYYHLDDHCNLLTNLSASRLAFVLLLELTSLNSSGLMILLAVLLHIIAVQ